MGIHDLWADFLSTLDGGKTCCALSKHYLLHAPTTKTVTDSELPALGNMRPKYHLRINSPTSHYVTSTLLESKAQPGTASRFTSVAPPL